MSYSFIVQKDLPLITWKLDDAAITGNSTVFQDGYMSTFPGTATTTNGVYKAAVTEKKFPIINGSPRSVYVTDNGTDSSAIQVPAMGFATRRYKSDPITLEFWIKPKTTLSTSTVQKIVGKPSSETGVYVHNSSFIGVIGDSAGTAAKVVIPVDNMSKPFHIAFVYQENSVSLIVNGVGKTVEFKTDVLTNTAAYSLSTDVFRFVDPGLDYAIDNISIYAYPMSILTARRHMVYGLGYEIPDSVAGNFGGYRYNFSLAQSKFAGSIQKHNASSWMNNSESNNLVIEKDRLRINNFKQPAMKFTEDKTSSIFSWDGTQGLKISSDGGFVELNPQRYGSYVKTGPDDTNPNGSGFSAVFKKSTAQNLTSAESQTLMVLQDPINQEYFLKIYLYGEGSDNEAIYYQINNNGGVKLGSTISGGINNSFTVGYFFNSTSNEITIFQHVNGAASGTSVTIENEGLFPIAYSATLRLMSNDVFGERELSSDFTASQIQRFKGGLLRVAQLDTNISSTASQIFTDANTRIDKYSAEANSTQNRFIIKATGWIRFKIDAKRLDGNNGIIGANRVDWGHDSSEVSVVASPIGTPIVEPFDTYADLDTQYSSYTQVDAAYSSFTQIYQEADNSWFTQETLSNRTAIKNIIGKESGNTRAILITMTFNSNDVELNPTIVSYFRLSSLPGTVSGGVCTSVITSNGPDIEVTYTDSKLDTFLPDYRDTPFFWTEEQGGLRVGRTAKINYDLASTSGTDAVSGLSAVSFFLNVPEAGNRTFLTVTDGTSTSSLTSSGNTFITSNATVYVNGSASNQIVYGVWQYITLVFSNRMVVGENTNVDITFGSQSLKSDFYIDELMTLDGSITASDISMFFDLYKGNYKASANNTNTNTAITNNEVIFYDSEISNNSEIYQPMDIPIAQTALLVDVDLASRIDEPFSGTTGNLTITNPTLNQLLIDGTYIQDGDRILLKNQSTTTQNGIFVATFTYGDALNPSKITLLTLTRQTPNPSTGSVVYVKDGVTNKGTHWVSTSGHTVWAESPFLKKVDAYTFEGTKEKTELVSKATITI